MTLLTECCAARELIRDRYLNLLESALTGVLTRDPPQDPWFGQLVDEGERKFAVLPGKFDPLVRECGKDWPATALTMIGTLRMRNFRFAIETVLERNVPGDIIETGVWRGGACIYARGVLAAGGVTDRSIYAADSFCGLPPPDANPNSPDKGDWHHVAEPLKVSRAEVQENFARFGLLDAQVKFVEGWFKDTLPSLPGPFSVIRLDGDMYDSTRVALESLYPKLSIGGYCIIDDYGAVKGCKIAVDEFRAKMPPAHQSSICNRVLPPRAIDGVGVYWRKCECEGGSSK